MGCRLVQTHLPLEWIYLVDEFLQKLALLLTPVLVFVLGEKEFFGLELEKGSALVKEDGLQESPLAFSLG